MGGYLRIGQRHDGDSRNHSLIDRIPAGHRTRKRIESLRRAAVQRRILPQRRARKRHEKEERKRAREREIEKVQKAQTDKPERRRGVFAFFASCWAELKKVQWPDRDTLVQASAVTIIFVAIMAAYLGALDAAFNWLIKQII